jgi:hypothetical protein
MPEFGLEIKAGISFDGICPSEKFYDLANELFKNLEKK